MPASLQLAGDLQNPYAQRSACSCSCLHCCGCRHTDFVTALDFHPVDDKYFLSGSIDGKVISEVHQPFISFSSHPFPCKTLTKRFVCFVQVAEAEAGQCHCAVSYVLDSSCCGLLEMYSMLSVLSGFNVLSMPAGSVLEHSRPEGCGLGRCA